MPSQTTRSSAGCKVVILLATKDGAEFLRPQLESYRAQTYANWELVVSDDGSTDDSVEIVKDFAKGVSQPVVVRGGPQQGFWQNFMSLVRAEDVDGDFFAYSDQDDIWFSEKLANAIAWFERFPADRPALYFTRTALIEADGTPVGLSPLFTRAPRFQNALVQNIGGGNTMVFNRVARQALAATPRNASLVSHDWWTYQLVTGMGGTAHYDPRPSLKYRQHGQNLVGSNIGWRARLVRLFAFASGRVVRWNDTNIVALNKIRHVLTPENVHTLDLFATARRGSLVQRLHLTRKSGVYRQSLIENIGLFLGAVFGRL